MLVFAPLTAGERRRGDAGGRGAAVLLDEAIDVELHDELARGRRGGAHGRPARARWDGCEQDEQQGGPEDGGEMAQD
ncbi:MAG: hypothetical protein ACXVFN_17155 [Solirubrobacteraceae bacterium]